MPKSDNVTSVQVNDSGTWKEVTELYYKDSGTWKLVEDSWTKSNGSIINFWQGSNGSLQVGSLNYLQQQLHGFYYHPTATEYRFGSIYPTRFKNISIRSACSLRDWSNAGSGSGEQQFQFSLPGYLSNDFVSTIRVEGNGLDFTMSTTQGLSELRFLSFNQVGTWWWNKDINHNTLPELVSGLEYKITIE